MDKRCVFIDFDSSWYTAPFQPRKMSDSQKQLVPMANQLLRDEMRQFDDKRIQKQ